MDVNTTRPSPELASLTASALQNARFKERRIREAQSDVRSDVVYYSPVVRIDNDSQIAVLQYRDASTGEVQTQYPSPRQIESYTQAQVRTEQIEIRSEAALEAVDLEVPKTDSEA